VAPLYALPTQGGQPCLAAPAGVKDSSSLCFSNIFFNSSLFSSCLLQGERIRNFEIQHTRRSRPHLLHLDA
jgi:hypothetical protein